MSLEEALIANTAALIANTEAHAKLAAVATAAAGSTPAESPDKLPDTSGDDAPSESAADKKKRLAAEKRAATAAAKKKAEAEAEKKAEAPDLSKLAAGVSSDKLKTLCGGFLKGDDEETRDANKEKFIAALSHLGAGKLTEVETAGDRAKLAAYIVYWSKGAEVDFEAVDEIVEGIIDGANDSGDDLLG